MLHAIKFFFRKHIRNTIINVTYFVLGLIEVIGDWLYGRKR